MKKGTIFAVCVAIIILASCVTPSAADGEKEGMAGDPSQKADIGLMTETEQPAVFAAAPRSSTVPTDIYPGDYEVILRDNTGDRFYLNQVKKDGVMVLYRGWWSSKWANGLIEPVTVSYYGSTTAMAITAVYKANFILSYTLIQSFSGVHMFYGSWCYAFKNNLHYYNKVFTATVTVEKGEFPTIIGGPTYNTP